MRAYGWGPNLRGLLSSEEEEKSKSESEREISFSTCEDTVRRRPAASQEKSCHQNTESAGSLYLDFQPLEL